jgi:DNA-directed RNA polymerase subunit RPC12/RpoP
MIPEVFECPRCERQFVVDGLPDEANQEVHCPQCSRFLGIRDVAFVLRSELDELIERLAFEKDRLEKDEAIYGMTDCDAEMKFYGREVSRVIQVLRGALKELHHLREDYRTPEE